MDETNYRAKMYEYKKDERPVHCRDLVVEELTLIRADGTHERVERKDYLPRVNPDPLKATRIRP